MAFRRREFLRGLAGLAPALSAMAGLTSASIARDTRAAPGFLSASERRTLEALADTLVAPGEKPAVTELPSVQEAGVVDFLDRLLPELPEEVRKKFPLLLWGLEQGARVLSYTGRPFTSLDGAERVAFLAGFAESRFEIRRLAFRAIKNLVMLGYYQADASWPGIGYDGPWVGRIEQPAAHPAAPVAPAGGAAS